MGSDTGNDKVCVSVGLQCFLVLTCRSEFHRSQGVSWPAEGQSASEEFICPKVLFTLMFVDPCIIVQFLQRKPQQDATVYQNFIIRCFKWSSTCFGRHTTHHQEPKTAQAASGFAYVEGCWTCSCWTLSGSAWKGALHPLIRYLTISNNCTSNSLPRTQNQRLLV